MTYDSIIAGAGFAGAVAARVLAEAGRRVLVLEQRPHVGGNAFDCLDASGILIHQYGPHIFHTNDKTVFDFLSRFTAWRAYEHEVVANLPTGNGRMELPVPFNLASLRLAFGPVRAAQLQEKLIAAYGAGTKVTILQLREATDPALSELAQYVYDHVFVRYTMKQWGQTPEEIDPATTARVPVRLSRDDRYFQDAYQGMPLEGYTPMFQKILDHPNITVELGVEARDRVKLEGGTVTLDGAPFTGAVIFTGQADELFGFRFGQLPYRTLDFRFETYEKQFYQTHGTVNYTVDRDYTRITEFKHLTGQDLPGLTTIMKEYSRAYTGAPGETPYYSIINPENNALYAKYAALASEYPNLHLLGRLAEYKYYNMDAIAGRALELCDSLLTKS